VLVLLVAADLMQCCELPPLLLMLMLGSCQ
jgi:hypothetical protein